VLWSGVVDDEFANNEKYEGTYPRRGSSVGSSLTHGPAGAFIYTSNREEAMTGGIESILPAWARRLVSEFDEADARAQAVARSLTPQQLNWSALPGTWSVGQCLAHLAIGNELYLAAIEAALSNRGAGTPVPEIIVGAPSRWFIRRYIAPSAHMKTASAPLKITPPTAVDADTLDRFLYTNEKARDVIRRAAGHDVNRLRFRNPFVPLIRFTVGTGLEILSKHEQRHLLQAERVKGSPTFPVAGMSNEPNK
jgi:hypothetical protein